MMMQSIERATEQALRYRSAFTRWHDKASVRTRPRRVLDGNAATYFPPELVPVVSHPLVTDLGPDAVHCVLVQRLYQYLNFTTELESVAVIPVTISISRGQSGLVLPGRMRADALAITTDEAWHAQFSEDLIHQVETSTQLPRSLPPVSSFTSRLEEIKHKMGTDLAGLADLTFAIVSETLISAILADLPKDIRLPQAVRDLVQDHALDEGRHHAYFRQLLTYFWPALDQAERQALGPWLPELISAFLAPDHTASAHALLAAGLTEKQTVQVLAETHDENEVQRGIAAAARTTVRYLADAGALNDPETQDAFLTAGLVGQRSFDERMG